MIHYLKSSRPHLDIMTKTSLSDFFIFQHKWNMDNTYLFKVVFRRNTTRNCIFICNTELIFCTGPHWTVAMQTQYSAIQTRIASKTWIDKWEAAQCKHSKNHPLPEQLFKAMLMFWQTSCTSPTFRRCALLPLRVRSHRGRYVYTRDCCCE